MNIHVCLRCDGSGHVTGRYGWEIPWTRWATDAGAAVSEHGLMQPHVCPDCGGTGALLEIPRPAGIVLPWGAIRDRGSAYADHVTIVRQTQGMKSQAN